MASARRSAECSPAGDQPGPRCGHTLTPVGEDRLVLFGGAAALEMSPAGTPGAGVRLAGATNAAHLLDARAGVWTRLAPEGEAPSARAAHAAASVGNSVVVLGGIGPSGLASEDWHKVPAQGKGPGPRYAHTLALAAQRYLVCIGGNETVNDGSRLAEEVWALDTAVKPYRWLRVEASGPVPPPRMYAAAASRDDGMLLLCAGRGAGNVALADVHALVRHGDGRWEWVAAPGPVPEARYQHAVTFVHDFLHVSGGAIGAGGLAEETDAALDTNRGTWAIGRPAPALGARRCRHASATIGRFVFLYGGLREGHLLSDLVVIEASHDDGTPATSSPSSPGAAKAQHGQQASPLLSDAQCWHQWAARARALAQHSRGDDGLPSVESSPPSLAPTSSLPTATTAAMSTSPAFPARTANTTAASSTPTPSLESASKAEAAVAAALVDNMRVREHIEPEGTSRSPTAATGDTARRSPLAVDFLPQLQPQPLPLQALSPTTTARSPSATMAALSPSSSSYLAPARVPQEATPSPTLHGPGRGLHASGSPTTIGSRVPESVRLHHRAVVIGQAQVEPGSGSGALSSGGGLLRHLSIDKFPNESRRVNAGASPELVMEDLRPKTPLAPPAVHQHVIDRLCVPHGWEPSADRSFVLDAVGVGELCDAAEACLREEGSVLHLQAPMKIFGDLHGQFGDLMRLFSEYGCPSTAGDIAYIDYLFLGDYVDRGTHSLETISLLLALKVKFPHNIHLLRGNHEASDVNALFGFREECITRMGEEQGLWAWQRFNRLFDWLPLAAVIGGRVACFHGGIGRSIERIEQLEALQRPLTMEAGGVVLMDLLWSDPTENDTIEGLRPNARGPGLVTFGPDRVRSFCDTNNIQLIVRAHECVMDGFERFAQGQLITVFSATNYCGSAGNAGAILVLGRDHVLYPKCICPYGLPGEDDDDPAAEHPAASAWLHLHDRPPTPPRGRPVLS